MFFYITFENSTRGVRLNYLRFIFVELAEVLDSLKASRIWIVRVRVQMHRFGGCCWCENYFLFYFHFFINLCFWRKICLLWLEHGILDRFCIAIPWATHNHLSLFIRNATKYRSCSVGRWLLFIFAFP